MFQFSGLASHAYLIQHAIIQGPWDQRLFDNSPKLFAAYHALHRLLSPRHPPHALCNLTTMICGSLTRTETLQPPDGHEKTRPPMQFKDYVVAELSKINAHQAISTTLSWVGRPCCGTGTLSPDTPMVKRLHRFNLSAVSLDMNFRIVMPEYGGGTRHTCQGIQPI